MKIAVSGASAAAPPSGAIIGAFAGARYFYLILRCAWSRVRGSFTALDTYNCTCTYLCTTRPWLIFRPLRGIEQNR